MKVGDLITITNERSVLHGKGQFRITRLEEDTMIGPGVIFQGTTPEHPVGEFWASPEEVRVVLPAKGDTVRVVDTDSPHYANVGTVANAPSEREGITTAVALPLRWAYVWFRANQLEVVL